MFRSHRKGQVAMEFMVYVGITLSIFVVIFGILSFQSKSSFDYNNEISFQQVCDGFSTAVNLAQAGGDGFNTTFTLPNTINGFTYTASIVEDGKKTTLQLEYGNEVVFCNLFPSNLTETIILDEILEAETNFSLDDGYVDTTNCICPSPSNGQCIRDQSFWYWTPDGDARYTSTLPNGIYDITYVVCPDDDSDDDFTVFVDGQQVDSYTTNGGEIWYERNITGVNIQNGDELYITCSRGGWNSYCRMDYVRIYGEFYSPKSLPIGEISIINNDSQIELEVST